MGLATGCKTDRRKKQSQQHTAQQPAKQTRTKKKGRKSQETSHALIIQTCRCSSRRILVASSLYVVERLQNAKYARNSVRILQQAVPKPGNVTRKNAKLEEQECQGAFAHCVGFCLLVRARAAKVGFRITYTQQQACFSHVQGLNSLQ